MLNLRKIAITGGIASGKSTVCQFLEELGAFVIKADAIGHELLENDTNLGKQVVKLLGPDILEHGKINRKRIAEKVFCSEKLLSAFEKLIHPLILRRIEELYQQACNMDTYTSFVVEIPLLFEIQAESFYDVTVAVVADDAIARKRFGKPDYDTRMKRHLSPSQKATRADYTIFNNGSLKDLRKQVIAFNQTL